ncbi:MAG: NAD(P)/FAD-dependent oxidoreductase, partial [Myxococcota bacterium]
MKSRSPDVLVVGGGVVGASCAWHLAREGASVTLLEAGTPASKASGAAAGMLLPLGEAHAKGGAFLAASLRSLARFPALAGELLEGSGVDPELEISGALHLARSEERAADLRTRARDLPGLGATWLDAQQARERAPLLADDLLGALHSPDEAHVRSPMLARAYLGAATALGTRVLSDAPVRGLLREGDRVVGARTDSDAIRADRTLLCAGTWSPELVRPL